MRIPHDFSSALTSNVLSIMTRNHAPSVIGNYWIAWLDDELNLRALSLHSQSGHKLFEDPKTLDDQTKELISRESPKVVFNVKEAWTTFTSLGAKGWDLHDGNLILSLMTRPSLNRIPNVGRFADLSGIGVISESCNIILSSHQIERQIDEIRSIFSGLIMEVIDHSYNFNKIKLQTLIKILNKTDIIPAINLDILKLSQDGQDLVSFSLGPQVKTSDVVDMVLEYLKHSMREICSHDAITTFDTKILMKPKLWENITCEQKPPLQALNELCQSLKIIIKISSEQIMANMIYETIVILQRQDLGEVLKVRAFSMSKQRSKNKAAQGVIAEILERTIIESQAPSKTTFDQDLLIDMQWIHRTRLIKMRTSEFTKLESSTLDGLLEGRRDMFMNQTQTHRLRDLNVMIALTCYITAMGTISSTLPEGSSINLTWTNLSFKTENRKAIMKRVRRWFIATPGIVSEDGVMITFKSQNDMIIRILGAMKIFQIKFTNYILTTQKMAKSETTADGL